MKYKRKIYTYFTVAIIVYLSINIILQTDKEKRYQTELKKIELSVYAKNIAYSLEHFGDTAAVVNLLPKNYRLTLIDTDGDVIFDNIADMLVEEENTDHINRPEIVSARQGGHGYAIRNSLSTSNDYMYYAVQTSNGTFIRIAMPFVVKYIRYIQTDNFLLYLVIVIFLVMMVRLLFISDKFGNVMETLKKFSANVEKGNIDYKEVRFPDTDSGEIGAKIISLYKQLEESKNQIYIEKDKNRVMKQTMSNNIAHELKTPVSSIRGYLETILHTQNITDNQRDIFIERAYNQTLRLTELIDDVTLLNKMEDASSLFEKGKVNVAAVFDEVCVEFADAIKSHNIVVINNINKNIEISGIHSLVHVIFRNLVENSIKYAGNNVNIEAVDVKQENNLIHFTYFDTGVGVDGIYLEKIFDRFVRIDEGRSRKNGGSGLGLAIVKHAVMFHGGSICASLRNGGGLQFDFTLKK